MATEADATEAERAIEAVQEAAAAVDEAQEAMSRLRAKAEAYDALVRKCDDRLGKAMRVLGPASSSGYRFDAPGAVLAAFDKLATR